MHLRTCCQKCIFRAKRILLPLCAVSTIKLDQGSDITKIEISLTQT